MFFKQFGGKVTKELIAQYEQSPNWKNGCFQNLVDVQVVMPFTKISSSVDCDYTRDVNMTYKYLDK